MTPKNVKSLKTKWDIDDLDKVKELMMFLYLSGSGIFDSIPCNMTNKQMQFTEVLFNDNQINLITMDWTFLDILKKQAKSIGINSIEMAREFENDINSVYGDFDEAEGIPFKLTYNPK